jgi:hypothetical protein
MLAYMLDVFRMVVRAARVLLLLAMTALVAAPCAGAAELVMFGRAGCPYCAQFDREVGAIYPRTEEGKLVPLRRIDIGQPLPPDLAFLTVERITPVFVLVDRNREIGRIRGYPGEDNFWGLLDNLIEDLKAGGPSGQPDRS